MITNNQFMKMRPLSYLALLMISMFTFVSNVNSGSMNTDQKSRMDTVDIKYKRYLEGVTFFASGDEPYWSMEVSKDNYIWFRELEGLDLKMKYVKSEKAMDANVRRYRTDSDSGIFTTTLSRSDCMNDMSGEVSAFTVIIELNDQGESNYRKFSGCGYFVPDFSLGRNWSIKKIGDKEVKGSDYQTKVTTLILNPENGTYEGYGGCNGYSGTFFMEDDILRFNLPLSTMMYCPDMEKEKALFDALAKATSYKIEGDELTLFDPEGNLLVFTGEKRTGDYNNGSYRLSDIWLLDQINGTKAEASHYMNGLPMLEINTGEQKFTGNGGCNRLNGTVVADDSKIKFSSISSTRMMCPGNYEPQFLEALKNAETYSIDNNMLSLMKDNKEILRFRKID